MPRDTADAMTTALPHLLYYWKNFGRGLVTKVPSSMRINCWRTTWSVFLPLQDTGDVCKLISKDSSYTMLSPELQKLANIALTILLDGMVWARLLHSLSSQNRAAQSSVRLSAAINIIMNGPPELSEGDARRRYYCQSVVEQEGATWSQRSRNHDTRVVKLQVFNSSSYQFFNQFGQKNL